MSKPIITKQDLINADVCTEQVELFEEIFGDSVVVTLSRAKKVSALFEWNWAVRLLDGKGRAEYKRVETPAWVEYERVTAPARVKYESAKASAWAEYDRVREAGRAEYERAIEAALAECERVTAPALVKYESAKASAWATAFINTKEKNNG